MTNAEASLRWRVLSDRKVRALKTRYMKYQVADFIGRTAKDKNISSKACPPSLWRDAKPLRIYPQITLITAD
jgi:hypothetical protein